MWLRVRYLVVRGLVVVATIYFLVCDLKVRKLRWHGRAFAVGWLGFVRGAALRLKVRVASISHHPVGTRVVDRGLAAESLSSIKRLDRVDAL